MIDAIQGINQSLSQIQGKKSNTTVTDDTAFTGALKQAEALLNATAEAENTTNALTYDFMTGKNDNIHDLLIAQEKSSILLQFTMQVRNQVVQAYQEIMRLSV